MSEIKANDDSFDNGLTNEDHETTAALEEDLLSSRAALPLSSALVDGPPHTELRRVPLPPLTIQAVLQARYQYYPNHQHQFPHNQQHLQGHSQRHSQGEPEDKNEATKLIEELKHKLYIIEHENKDLERKLRDSEDIIKRKELEYLSLKRQLELKSRQSSTSTQSSSSMRAFPEQLAPPHTESKIRETATTSTPSQRLGSTSSQEISDAMESLHLSSQHPSPSTSQLTGMQSPTPSTQHYTPPTIKSKPMSVSDLRWVLPPVPTNTVGQSASAPRPSLPAANYPDAPKQIPYNSRNTQHSNANLNMLKLLFSDVFKETNKSRAAKIDMMLTRDGIPAFARDFCDKLKPADDACSLYAKEKLLLLVSDIQDAIILSENPNSTIPSLLTLFNHCLPICIDEKLHDIILTIVTVLKRLVTFLPTAKNQMVKEVERNLTNSTVYNLVSVLAMYSFKKPPAMYYVVEEFPDIVNANSNDINRLAQKYSTTPREIAKALVYEKTPTQAGNTVRSVLAILSIVISRLSGSTLPFLLTDMAFLNLLSLDTPLDILEQACVVLGLSMGDLDSIKLGIDADGNKPLPVVTQLCGLLNSEEPSEYYPQTWPTKQHDKISPSQWYSVCNSVCELLRLVALLKLPDSVALVNKKTILSTILAFSMRCCEFDPSNKTTDHINNHQTLVQSSCRALLTIVKSVKSANLFDHDTISKLQNLVIFYVDKSDDTHPARPLLLAIEKWLDEVEN